MSWRCRGSRARAARRARAREGRAFGRALHFDEAAGARHDDIHVGVAGRVFGVVEIEHGDAADRCRPKWRRRSRLIGDCCEQALVLQPGDRVVQRDEGAGDRRGARAAVGLDHIAIEL